MRWHDGASMAQPRCSTHDVACHTMLYDSSTPLQSPVCTMLFANQESRDAQRTWSYYQGRISQTSNPIAFGTRVIDYPTERRRPTHPRAPGHSCQRYYTLQSPDSTLFPHQAVLHATSLTSTLAAVALCTPLPCTQYCFRQTARYLWPGCVIMHLLQSSARCLLRGC